MRAAASCDEPIFRPTSLTAPLPPGAIAFGRRAKRSCGRSRFAFGACSAFGFARG
jgi:hypothetical protein